MFCSQRMEKVRFFVHSWQVQSFLHMLDFIERPGDMPFCLWRIGRFRSVDARLHDVPFKEYVSIENYYQGFYARAITLFCVPWQFCCMWIAKGGIPAGSILRKKNCCPCFCGLHRLRIILQNAFPICSVLRNNWRVKPLICLNSSMRRFGH